jgi:RNA polymerase sigma factor (sigma-70 family)
MATVATKAVGRVLASLRESALRRDGAGLTDAELLGCFIARRDEAAFEALLRRHGPMVLGVCRRVLRNEAEAEDAFQATFLVLVRRATAIQPLAMVGNWLYGVALRTARNVKSLNQRHREKVRQAAARLTAEASTMRLDLLECLYGELRHMPEKYRAVIVACDLEGRSIQEAARAFRCPSETIGTRLARARALLTRRMRRHGPISAGLLLCLLAQHTASAAVPARLFASFTKAASLYAAGYAPLAGAFPDRAVALTEGVLRAMFLTRMKFTTSLVLAILAVAWIGATFGTDQARGQNKGGQPGSVAAESRGSDRKDAGPESRSVQADGTVRALAWGPGGKVLVTLSAHIANSGHAVQVRDGQTGKVIKTLFQSDDPEYVGSLTIIPNGKSIAAALPGLSEVIKLWDVDTGKEMVVLKGVSGVTEALACSPDGKLLARATWRPGDADRRVLGAVDVWELSSGRLLWQQAEAHIGQACCLAFSPDSQVLVSGGRSLDKADYKGLKLWDAKTGKCKLSLDGHGTDLESDVLRTVNSVAFSPDGKLLASGSADGAVRLWDLATGKLKQTLTDAYVKGYSVNVAFAPDGKSLASAGITASDQDKGDLADVKLWDPQTGKLRQTITGYRYGVFSLKFSPDGGTLGLGLVGKLQLLPVGK